MIILAFLVTFGTWGAVVGTSELYCHNNPKQCERPATESRPADSGVGMGY